jgi:large conductance mechanosensitive channel
MNKVNEVKNRLPKVELFDEFMGFIVKFGVIGLAIGTVVGGAVKELVDSIVKNILGPILGLIPNMKGLESLNIARDAAGKFILNGVADKGDSIVLNYGPFIGSLINFLALMLVVFLVIKFVISHVMTDDEKNIIHK